MEKKQKSLLDPRTKLFLLVLNSIFLTGGIGGDVLAMRLFRHLLVAITLLFLLLYGKKKQTLVFFLLYVLFYTLKMTIFPQLQGVMNYILLFSIGMIVHILPTVMTGHLLVSTTKAKDLVGALRKMHISNSFVIPITVIIRFFPTIAEEYKAISGAMSMRGLRVFGNRRAKLIEYRMIPLIICSVKAGEELSAAALARGLGSPIARTRADNIGFRVCDYITIAFVVVMFVIAILQGILV